MRQETEQMKRSEESEGGLLGTIVQYSSSNFYRQFLSLLNAFIRPKLLTPELYGLWQILIVIPGYAAYSSLGLNSMVRFLVPYHHSRNEGDRIREITGSVVYGSLAIKLAITFVLILIAVTVEMSLKVRMGLLTMACMVMMEWYVNYHMAILHAYQKFSLISAVNYLRATVAFIGSVILIYYFNIYGVYLAAILTISIVISYLRLKHPLRSFGRFTPSVFIDLVKKGFPLLIFNISVELVGSSDKLIIAALIGTEQLGYYGIAVMVHHFVMNIPVVTRNILEIKLMKNISKNSQEESLREFLLKPLVNTAYFMPFLIGPIILLLPVLIPLLLPRYTPGILPTQILTLGCYFFAISFVTRGMIVANNWQLQASKTVFAVLLFNVAASVTLVKMGYGIAGVASASSVSLFLYCIGMVVFVKNRCVYARTQWRAGIRAAAVPFPLMVASIFLLEHLVPFITLSVYFAVLIKLSAFVIIMYGATRIAARNNPFVKTIRIQRLLKKR